MVRLPNQDKMIALLLNDHGAALVRSDTHTRASWVRRIGLGGGDTSQAILFTTTVLCPRLRHESSTIARAFEGLLNRLNIPLKIPVQRRYSSL
jgi:hypothetical protein